VCDSDDQEKKQIEITVFERNNTCHINDGFLIFSLKERKPQEEYNDNEIVLDPTTTKHVNKVKKEMDYFHTTNADKNNEEFANLL